MQRKPILTTPILKLLYQCARTRKNKPSKVNCYVNGKMNNEEFEKLKEMGYCR